MPAHLRELSQPKCHCGRPAKVALYNTFNDHLANLCRPHGNAELRKALAAEDRHKAPEPLLDDVVRGVYL